MTRDEAVKKVLKEVGMAVEKHGHIPNFHHGYALLLEEVDELWDEIKKKSENRSVDNLTEEASQIAAIAIRILVDLC